MFIIFLDELKWCIFWEVVFIVSVVWIERFIGVYECCSLFFFFCVVLGKICRWCKREGDEEFVGDILCEIEVVCIIYFDIFMLNVLCYLRWVFLLILGGLKMLLEEEICK